MTERDEMHYSLFPDPELSALTIEADERWTRAGDLACGNYGGSVSSTQELVRMLAAPPIIGWTAQDQTPMLLNARIVDPLLHSVFQRQYVRTIWYEAPDQQALDVVQFATVELLLARENALEQCVDMPMKLTNRECHEMKKERQGRLGKRPAKFYSGWQNAVRLLNDSPALAQRIAGWVFGKDRLDCRDYEALISSRVGAQRISQVLSELNRQDGAA